MINACVASKSCWMKSCLLPQIPKSDRNPKAAQGIGETPGCGSSYSEGSRSRLLGCRADIVDGAGRYATR